VSSGTQRLVVVGGGRMGTAIVRGLGAAGWDLGSVTVVEVDPGRRAELARALPGVGVVSGPVPAEGAVLAVKPQSAEEAARALAAAAVPRWLSIMAGVTLGRLRSWAGPAVALVRAMPNTPALVGEAVSAVSAGPGAAEADLQWAEAVLGAVGQVVRVPEEALDAVTAVSGSGPAYVFLLAEALAEAGAEQGLDPGLSLRLALATVAGAGRLLAQPGADPRWLRAQVTSPGGTTEAAVAVLEEAGLRRAVAAAVEAAARRSRDLGAEPG
jgi:pyrroline-5-carboxylate reductase